MPQTAFLIRRDKKDKSPIKVFYDFGDNIPDSVAKFDGPTPLDTVVHHLFKQAGAQQLAEFVRGLATPKVPKTRKAKGKKGSAATQAADKSTTPPPALLTEEEIQAKVAAWKPTIKQRGKPALDKAKKAMANLTPLERAVLLSQLADSDSAPSIVAPTDDTPPPSKDH